MRLVLFAMIFIIYLILKIQSSHTFKERGFYFRDKNVHDYLKQQAPELKKICQGTRNSYSWELPISNSKALEFEEVIHKEKFDLFPQISWNLMRINGEINFNPRHQESTLTISFQIRKEKKEIHLEKLFPTFPKVSGVDILQFLMSLSYVCDFTLSLRDASDISISYRMLHGTGYYENLIKGNLGLKMANQNKIISKKDFYECANHELLKLNNWGWIAHIDEILNSCQKKAISVQDCPIHYLWLGKAIHYILLPICGLKYKGTVFLPQPFLVFHITPKDLTQIFNKLLPKSKLALHPNINNCTSKVKDYKTVKKNVISLKFFEHAFDFCFPDMEFTALSLFDILKGCVTETLNFLWKNECHLEE